MFGYDRGAFISTVMVTLAALRNRQEKVAVVGLGYVGLPLAILLAHEFDVIGFDINARKIENLQRGVDETGEVDEVALRATPMQFTADVEALRAAKFFILAIPTPVDAQKKPDMSLLERASEMLGKVMPRESIVVYESTVYPGVTEELCVPVIERASGFQCGRDFSVGYSPERVNPGDKEHTIDRIVKVVSGMDEATLDVVAGVYGAVCKAGVHRASSIKVAEAAKAIENAQRDINIAFMNELSLIFHRMDIPTKDVIAAAATKWNFLKFTPGLVGGHCIGVDPYYLAERARALGYEPRVILAGREVNDWMPRFIAEELVTKMSHAGLAPEQVKVTMLGVTFKENIPDVRNSKAAELAQILRGMGVSVKIFDPHADPEAVRHEYQLELCRKEECAGSNVVILATAHKVFLDLTEEWIGTIFDGPPRLFMDVRNACAPKYFEENGIAYWAL